MIEVTCLHTHRDNGCMQKAIEANCPMFVNSPRCFGCVNTGFTRYIPVQGSTSAEQTHFKDLLNAAGTVG